MFGKTRYFYVANLGCKVNRAEVDSYSAKLMASGWKISKVEDANLIIVNTCTVTHVADAKTRKTVRNVCKKNNTPDCKILVTGCAAVLDPDFYTAIDPRIKFVAKASVSEYINNLFNSGTIPTKKQAKILAGDNFRTRAAIKIQDGCDNACTYCIVHVARGKSTSVPADKVVDQARALLSAGVREINLTGVNIGAYDDDGLNLAGLLCELLKIIEQKFDKTAQVPARFRLGSIEPQDVTDQLIDVIAAANGRICRHFHLPLQSGSTKVLGQMGRHYTAEQFVELVQKIKTNMPTAAFSTDIICGFPGETDYDFQQTLQVAKDCGFMKIHVFPYSIRQGTPAAERQDQIFVEVKDTRCKQLQELSQQLAKKDLAKRKDAHEFALVEAPNRARLESYHLVTVMRGTIGQLIQFSEI